MRLLETRKTATQREIYYTFVKHFASQVMLETHVGAWQAEHVCESGNVHVRSTNCLNSPIVLANRRTA